MSEIWVSATEGTKFPPLEAGTYPAVCVGIVDMGEVYSEMFDKTSRKVTIQWELPDEFIEVEGEKRARIISETYTASLNEKAALRKMLEGWRGRQFTSEEMKRFGLSNVLRAGCLLGIINQDGKDGRTFSKVSTVSRLPKGYADVIPTIKPFIFSMENADDLPMLDDMPEWLQKRIKESNTYKNLTGTQGFEEIDEPLPWEK